MKFLFLSALMLILAGGLTAQRQTNSVLLERDKAPDVYYPIPNIEALSNADDFTLVLSDYFSVPENSELMPSYEIVSNSHPDVSIASIIDNELTIDFLSPGQSYVIIEATINELSAKDTFTIGVRPLINGEYPPANFEDINLESSDFWNGSDQSGGFSSGPLFFANTYNPDWYSWSGWACSNTNDITTPGFMNQYSAISPVRLDSTAGKNYGISYASPSSVIYISDNSNRIIKGFFTTNSTYAALSMKYGDDYTKKFGGIDGKDPDWLNLQITGYNLEGDSTGTVNYKLADFTSEDNSKDYIIETWQWVDLTSLGEVHRLDFSMSSTDNGDWGMNTPAFFCMDNLHLADDAINVHYISEVHEYVPAPSQYMNAAPWGTPSSAESIIGGIDGHVSLGAFGGYIVFSFDQPVENHPLNPFGVDFTIFGNPLPNWSEPGIVSVMKDENKNGEPDDTWFELAGSDYNFSSTIRNYKVTYSNPGGPDSQDIPWTDNMGFDGVVETNSFYLQPYYPLADSFPEIDQNSYTLKGSMIKSTVDTAFEAGIHSLKRVFGYVDNQFIGKAPYTVPDNPYTIELENSGGDAFDISWAIDSSGSYVDLDEVDFIKVHTAVMDGAGWLGQISTEIRGAVDVSPEETTKGKSRLLVIRDMPLILNETSFQLEIFAFDNGRIKQNEKIDWSCSLEGATVDENNILHVEQSGELTVTASLASNSEISASASTTIELDISKKLEFSQNNHIIGTFPNPANESIRFQKGSFEMIYIVDVSGKTVIHKDKLTSTESIDISNLSKGIYFIRAFQHSISYTGKFIKQ